MVRGRFAPSPSGRMHLGNAFSALLAWLSAKSRGGEIVLRVEDLDPARSRREHTEAILDDLRWLGLEWDLRAEDQSKRGPAYAEALARLEGMGLIYPCYCSRDELHAASAPHASDGRVLYSGACRDLTPAQRAARTKPPCLRLRVPDRTISFTDGLQGPQALSLSREWGDFIVRRADGVAAYQLAVVVDDAANGVTEVVRGRDLLLSSPQQIYVARLLGFPSPRFIHLSLLCNAAGQRLSKRDQSLDMESLRQRYTPQQLIGLLACLAGLKSYESPVSAQALAADFSWDRVPRADISLV